MPTPSFTVQNNPTITHNALKTRLMEFLQYTEAQAFISLLSTFNGATSKLANAQHGKTRKLKHLTLANKLPETR